MSFFSEETQVGIYFSPTHFIKEYGKDYGRIKIKTRRSQGAVRRMVGVFGRYPESIFLQLSSGNVLRRVGCFAILFSAFYLTRRDTRERMRINERR